MIHLSSVPWSPDINNIYVDDITKLVVTADFVANYKAEFINIPGRFQEGAKVTNTHTGGANIILTNVGTIEVPNFMEVEDDAAEAAGVGMNQLTGDITAGPGTGSQATTVVKIQGQAVSSTAPTNLQVLQYQTGTNEYVPTTFSAGGATWVRLGSITVADINGAVGTSSFVGSSTPYPTGTFSAIKVKLITQFDVDNTSNWVAGFLDVTSSFAVIPGLILSTTNNLIISSGTLSNPFVQGGANYELSALYTGKGTFAGGNAVGQVDVYALMA